MNLIYLALLCGLIATSFVHKSEARLHTESIVGGTASTVHQNTYAVSIQTNNRHFCGGGILNNRYIITVAHCFIDHTTKRFENYEYSVVAGATKAHNTEETYRVKREVEKIYIPLEYNPIVRNRYDIAVLELKSNLGPNLFISNVVLPPVARRYPSYENQQAVVCSYGHNWVTMRRDEQTNEDVEDCTGSNCNERRFAEVKIISNKACAMFYNDLINSHLCGHMLQRSRTLPEGLCTVIKFNIYQSLVVVHILNEKGDSGAPLVVGNTIIGVVSSSPEGCREDIKPAIYTRVTSFIPFIKNAVNGVKAANMRLAKYEVISCGRTRSCNKKVLVE